MQHDLEEFYRIATETFGNKFIIKEIQISDEDLKKFNEKSHSNLTREQIQSYRQCWLLENKCPKCGAELSGLFGSFEWGLVHGVGRCSECKSVDFKLYHYIEDCKVPIEAFALIGF